MSHELLLAWISERGEGTLASYRSAVEWLRGADEPWTRSLTALQSLGHVDVDWVARRWRAAPPAFAVLDDTGGYALLTGSRPRWLEDRLDALQDDPDPEVRGLADEVVLQEPVRQHEGPGVRYVTYEHADLLRDLADRLRVGYLERPSEQLAQRLPALNELLVSGKGRPLPGGFAVSRMSDAPGPLFRETEDITKPGAYEFHTYGAHRFFYRHSAADAFEAEKGVVIYAELRRQQRHVLRWDPQHNWLLVPARMRLPLPHDRVLVLRTGVLPDYLDEVRLGPSATRLRDMVRYRHIDRLTATSVARSLGQKLQEPV